MSASELLAQLFSLGARVWLDGDAVRVNAPRGRISDELWAELGRRKEELRAHLRRDRGDGVKRPPLCAGERPARLPLSFAQQRLWFIDQLEGGSRYNVPQAFRLRGPLDLGALESGLQTIVARHESLRTHFVQTQGDAEQVIAPELRIVLPLDDLSDLGEAARQEAVRAAIRREGDDPFDLCRGPLLRLRLLKLGEQEHILLRTLHHIVADGWSLDLFNRELGALYGGASLPPLSLQYADFALWQRQLLDGEELQRGLRYWTEQLAGMPEQVCLPSDGPRPATPTYEGGRYDLRLSPQATARLRTLSRDAEATLYMTLLAAFALLLDRYGAQEDVVIGTPIAGRQDSQLEPLIGFFVNSLVMRVAVHPLESFRALLAQVRATTLDAYRHQEIPFERLVEALAPGRSPGRAPLIQTMFALQNAPAAPLQLDGLAIESLPSEAYRVRFDLEVHAVEADAGLDIIWLYDFALFERPRIAQMARCFTALLEAIGRNPDAPLYRHEPEHVAEQDDQPATKVGGGLLPERFEAQVARTPAAIALRWAEHSMSFAELNARANRLAHHLIDRGIGPENLVAVCLPRGAELVVALLGILKAGAAYIPLDPRQPQARIEQILADAAPALLLTPDSLAALAPELAQQPQQNPRDRRLRAGNAAYAIWTSGSTGTPKGVVVAHGELSLYLDWASERYQAQLGQGAPLNTAIAFDATLTSLYLPLLCGRPLWLLPEEREIEALAELLLSGAELTLVKLTPAHLELLRALIGDRAHQIRARCFVVGGEALQGESAAFWRRYLPVINEYGPTETVVGCCIHQAGADDPVRRDLPIGRPTPQTRLYVLDRTLQPMPTGAIGELYIGGDQLGRGYLQRPGLTAQRFVADPYASEPGRRMYRSGDLARRRDDGLLEYCGRADAQLKVRGFRVEPGEIEALLTAQPGVAQAAVIASDEQLVAYLVGDADEAALRRELRRALPDYMVPAAFVFLAALPLTANGKLDRRALPTPERRGGVYRPPRTPKEEILCAIFAEVLQRDHVGIDDDFFALGGHSLLAAAVVGRIRAVLGVELAMRVLFEAPSVAALAAQLPAGARAGAPLQRQPRPARLPLSYAQERMWLLQRLGEANGAYNIPLALHLAGEVDAPALALALNDLIERHEVLRSVFPEQDGVPCQRVLSEARVELRREQITPAAAASLAFDLTEETPLRAWLFAAAPEQRVLLLVFHHIAADGGSFVPLLRDLDQAYAARRRGELPSWRPLPLQYADYALWQRQAGDAALAQQLEFWRGALADSPAQLTLPADHRRPPLFSYRGGSVRTELDAALHRRLAELARDSGASLFMVLAAGFAALLSRLGAGADIPLGTPIANRDQRASEDLVGLFVNTLVLRCDLSGQPSFRELLRRVRGFALDAYEHADLPFERLVEALQPERSLGRQPLFQVMIVLEHAGAEALPGFVAHSEPVARELAKFDLTLGLRERPGYQGIEALLEFSSDLFERATAESMLSRFGRLLRAALEQPDLPLQRLNLLAEGEAQALIGSALPASATPELLQHRFEAQVSRTPAALALVDGARELSYAALNTRANRLARQLIARGVGPESLVAVELERSLELVVALLGVLKAGAAYLPLDPGYPRARIAEMLADATPALVIDSATLAALEAEPVPDATRYPRPRLHPQHPAYVIYTSGSTGKPKGVVIAHRELATYLAWASERYGAECGAGAPVNTAISFDATITSLFLPLACGRTVTLVDQARQLEALAELLNSGAELTLVKLTPAHLEALRGAVDLDRIRARLFVVGGEALKSELAAYWRGRVALINEYGPTETVVGCCIHEACPDDDAHAEVAIGAATPHTRLYVLDQALAPAPLGVAGELYIGGAQLGRGYLNRRGLTAQRFVADPYAVEPGARMYRSGDLVRRRRDGELEFLGRTDEQVKIRGIRIEPGEVEAAIAAQPEVTQVAVVARDNQLLAYVVGDIGESELAQRLRARLPEHLVPGLYIFLDALPLTAHGKLDRRALPTPQRKREGYRAPRRREEEILCELFAALLKLERVGIDDNFFRLGGDSIMSIQLVSRARRAGLMLSARDVFQQQTVAALAEVARPAEAGAVWDADAGIGELPHTPIMRWFGERGGELKSANQALLVAVPREVGEVEMEAALQALLDTHDALRLRLDAAARLVIAPRGRIAARDCLRRVAAAALEG